MNGEGQPPFSAAVLAGGRSSRMGQDKAFLSWQGQTLLARQWDRLKRLQPEQLFISGRPGVDYGPAEGEVLLDETPDCGPLGGLAALLTACRTPHLLVLAVDLPLMTEDFLRDLVSARRPGKAVVPRRDGQWEPLAALYPRSAESLAKACLQSGQRSLQRLIDEMEKEDRVVVRDIEPDEEKLFRNLNRPEDMGWEG